MRLPVDDEALQGISMVLIQHGVREEDQLRVIRDEIQRGMVVADIGANLGYYALLEAALVGPGGFVYAVEPGSRNFGFLQENLALNEQGRWVESFRMAIADRTGTARLFLSEYANCHSLFENAPVPHLKTDSGTQRYETVSVSDLDSFSAGKRPINFIRMDVEGYEVKVFRGMRRFVERARQPLRILFEVHRDRYDDGEFDMAKELRFLFEQGFVPKTLIAKPLLESKPWGLRPFAERGYAPDLVMRTDGFERGLYSGITPADVIHYVTQVGCVRALLLVRGEVASPDVVRART